MLLNKQMELSNEKIEYLTNLETGKIYLLMQIILSSPWQI